MRTDREFIHAYSRALRQIDPEAEEVPTRELRLFGAVELCLTFLRNRVPDADTEAIPPLLLGYPLLPTGSSSPESYSELAVVRHICVRFAGRSAWVDACAQYNAMKETWRCHRIEATRIVRRSAAPLRLVEVVEETLRMRTPWSQATLQVAAPGPANVRVEHGRKTLAYEIPPVAEQRQRPQRHELPGRATNPPITVEWADLYTVADRIDKRERDASWPSDVLPPLNLAQRLRKVSFARLDSDDIQPPLTLDGATHVVGMLSSGKSTLVWGLVFALTLNDSRRVAMIASDTIRAAAWAARLRRHGVRATVVSSVRNRARHFGAIQWRQALSTANSSLTSIGELSEGFGMACPLDGYQREPDVVAGDDDRVVWPEMSEKPCHRLYQRVSSDLDDESAAQDVVDGSGKSCPLFNVCPAQEQQRAAVSAQVIIMTPQAFVHMTPDRWTTEERITFPELVQHGFDLVIMDEVDSVQKAFDDAFAPISPIMGDDRDVYAPNIGMLTSEALRRRSGHQFRNAANTRWQSNFYTLFRLIGLLYALLQRDGQSIGRLYKSAPFTSAGILTELWRLSQNLDGTNAANLNDAGFLDVMRVATIMGRFSRASAVAADQDDGSALLERISDKSLRAAAEFLRDAAAGLLTSDYYEELLPGIEAKLQTALAAFNVEGKGGHWRNQVPFNKRSNACALLLAVLTELVLAHYNWLVKAQPGVAHDFGIDDGQLLSQASNLIRHYQTLLPANPAGGAFGLLYDEPPPEKQNRLGGRLTLVNHLGVGRHLVVHLHDLLRAEGQAGPHVLMLSGTSWAGGDRSVVDPGTGITVDLASPQYDVQVPVSGILMQPDAELAAVQRSVFALFELRDADEGQVTVSGVRPARRPRILAHIADSLACPRDGGNLLERQWKRLEQRWGAQTLEDRRRALLVVNSYADATTVADAIVQSLSPSLRSTWKVYALVQDRRSTDSTVLSPMLARPLPRSLVERFGSMEECGVLVAPLSVISRGHNILNKNRVAAISSIYFLHRPHPRPDDLAPVIARLNRLAVRSFDTFLPNGQSTVEAGRELRSRARATVRTALAMRGGYSSLPPMFKAQFAWDVLTPLWQTIGRGIRGGVPVHVGFVDRKFAPRSFDNDSDSPDTSVLVQALRQLQQVTNTDSTDAVIAKRLYGAFFEALKNTEGLRYE